MGTGRNACRYLVSVPSECSVDSVSSVDSELSELSEEFCCPRNLREGESGRRAFVKFKRGEEWRKNVFLQNEAIMSFRINKSNGFVWV